VEATADADFREAMHLTEAAADFREGTHSTDAAVLGALIAAAVLLLVAVVSVDGDTIGTGAPAGTTMVPVRAFTLDMGCHITTTLATTIHQPAAIMTRTATGTAIRHAMRPMAPRPIRTGPIDGLLSEPLNVK
jgi:hypothetical protein